MSESSFFDNPFCTALCHHSDKNSAAINNRYLHFVQKRDLLSLVNDDHVDNNLKEILVYVYFGSIVISRPKNTHTQPLVVYICICIICACVRLCVRVCVCVLRGDGVRFHYTYF